MSAAETAHIASARIDVSAAFALEKLADPAAIGRWALGSMDLRETDTPGLFRGVSLFDGSETFVEISPRPEIGLVDYRVGGREARLPSVSARVISAEALGGAGESCLVALMAWRCWQVDDARWSRTRESHGAEILLLKAQLEAVYAEQAR